jgi:hypothetical protein
VQSGTIMIPCRRRSRTAGSPPRSTSGEALAVRCDINLDPLDDAEQADLLALLELVPDELAQVQQQLPECLDALRLSLSGY